MKILTLDLGWGLRFCISEDSCKLLGDADVAGLGTTPWGARGWSAQGGLRE